MVSIRTSMHWHGITQSGSNNMDGYVFRDLQNITWLNKQAQMVLPSVPSLPESLKPTHSFAVNTAQRGTTPISQLSMATAFSGQSSSMVLQLQTTMLI
jgi:FtsP/CotA-like multicopper oxidase with cupredoxin domain